jgi:hypothetical protein
VIVKTLSGRSLAVLLSMTLSGAAPAVLAAAPADAGVGPHLVDAADVARRLVSRAESRDEKVQLFRSALATPEARRQALALGLSADRLQAAVPHLSDRELDDLAARAARARDLPAGHYGGDSGLALIGLLLLLAGLAVLVSVSYDDDYYYDDCYCY